LWNPANIPRAAPYFSGGIIHKPTCRSQPSGLIVSAFRIDAINNLVVRCCPHQARKIDNGAKYPPMPHKAGGGRRKSRRISCTASHRPSETTMPRSAKDQLHIAQVEAEHVVQPDDVADDLGWEPMTIVGVGWRLHTVSLTRCPADCNVRLP
jgi:hypothetical protein